MRDACYGIRSKRERKNKTAADQEFKNSNFKQEFWDFKQKINKENKKLWYFKFPKTNRKSENFSFSEERQTWDHPFKR